MTIFTANTIIERLETLVEELKEREAQLTQEGKEKDAMMQSLRAQLAQQTKLKAKLHDILDARDAEIVELKEALVDANTELKTAFLEVDTNWRVAKKYTDTIIRKRDDEIAELKRQIAATTEDGETIASLKKTLEEERQFSTCLKVDLDEYRTFTESAIAKASEIEGDLFMKNGELKAQVELLTELTQHQTKTICDMETDLTAAEEEVDALRGMVKTKNAKLEKAEQDLYTCEVEYDAQVTSYKAEMATTKNKLEYANQMLACIAQASNYISDILSRK
jgi:chromosome segregation ATPase